MTVDDEQGRWPSKELPDTWTWARFNELFRNVTSSKRKLKQKLYSESGPFPVIDQGQQEIGGYTSDPDLLHDEPLPVLIFGDHTKAVKYIGCPFVQGADGVKVLRPQAALEPFFGYFSLLAVDLPDKGYSRHFKFLTRTQFPVPPLPEQKRIVTKIQALQAKSQKARTALEAIPPLLERFRQSVLAAAFRGDLTADWRAQNPDVEPASVLLDRIRVERRKRWEEAELAKMKAKGKEPKNDKWKSRYKEPVSLPATRLHRIPDSWCWTTLSTLAALQGGLAKGKKRRPKDQLRRVPYLRVANVQRGFLALNEVSEIEATENEIERLRLLPGDIFFTEGGDRDKLGRGWVWEGQLRECIHQNHVFRARVLDNAVPPKLVSYYANSHGQQFFFDQGKQTTNLASLSLTKLSGLPVPLLPAQEASVLEQRVQDLLTSLSSLEARFTSSRERCDRLEQAVLRRAFQGKLVPQNPSDEPASLLLERLRSARETEAAVVKAQRTPIRSVRPKRRRRMTLLTRSDVEPDHLAALLRKMPDQSAEPSELWQRSGLEIGEFYKQLKAEILKRLVVESEDKKQLMLAG